ncbi:MAG: Crp/Fnr family transcriptional regulator, partial [Leptospiraceae bacterium]|nr:Crp/Fnr family transcriptional regulator [Leptospiraceae bacterium]
KSRKLAYIGKGVMRAYHSSPNGSEYTKTIFLENEFIAPLAALTTGEGSPISLQALTDTELLVADYFELERLYRKHHCLEHMGRVIIQWEWVKKEVREIRLVTLSAEERYNLFLAEFPGLEHRIPWYYIASFLGITPVALSRIRGRKRTQHETEPG